MLHSNVIFNFAKEIPTVRKVKLKLRKKGMKKVSFGVVTRTTIAANFSI
jgi:hypothetical protein